MLPETARRRAGGLLLVEGLGLLGLGVADAVVTAAGSPTSRGLSFAAAGLSLLAGAALLGLGRSVARAGGWARSPAVVVQLLAFPVGTGLAQGRVWVAAAPVLLLAGATLFHLALLGPDLRTD